MPKTAAAPSLVVYRGACLKTVGRSQLTAVVSGVNFRPSKVPLLSAEAVFFHFKEDPMVEVTPSATAQIAEYFKGKEASPIRIFLNEGG